MDAPAGILCNRPFADPEDPAGDETETQHEDEQDRSGTHRHQRLNDELRVEVDAVECTDASRRRIRKQHAVQEHRPAEQVQTQEHRQREDEVNRNPGRGHGLLVVRQDRRPREVDVDRRWVDGADEKFRHDLDQHWTGHGDAPVLDAVVDCKQLTEQKTLSADDQLNNTIQYNATDL